MGKKILLADDSITIQKVIELTFSDEDFDVVTVGNGRLALEKLPDVRPDIVLCDIIMPEKDGYEVCEQIKRNPSFAHIPVLLLTGAFEPFDQERAVRAGSDGFLAKPFEPETLIAKVKDLLGRPAARPAPVEPHTAAVTAVVPPLPPLPPPALPVVEPRPLASPPPLPLPASPAAAAFWNVPPVTQPPAPAPPAPPKRDRARFIPDEPFGELEPEAFGEEPKAAAPPPVAFAPVTPEEAASLGVPAPETRDSASTVMFHAGQLPWSPPPSAPAPEPKVTPPVAEGGEGPFEEIIEEDLDFGPSPFPPPATGEMRSTLAAEPAPRAVSPFVRAPSPVPPPPSRPVEPEPPRAPVTAPPLAAEPPPPPAPPVVEQVVETSEFEPASPPPAESFADLGVPPGEPAAAPPSAAAAVPVPVDMVETIAQRVVAQISEKVVREIAWEVVPDLAEALLKAEIERLKAELEKIS